MPATGLAGRARLVQAAAAISVTPSASARNAAAPFPSTVCAPTRARLERAETDGPAWSCSVPACAAADSAGLADVAWGRKARRSGTSARSAR